MPAISINFIFSLRWDVKVGVAKYSLLDATSINNYSLPVRGDASGVGHWEDNYVDLYAAPKSTVLSLLNPSVASEIYGIFTGDSFSVPSGRIINFVGDNSYEDIYDLFTFSPNGAEQSFGWEYWESSHLTNALVMYGWNPDADIRFKAEWNPVSSAISNHVFDSCPALRFHMGEYSHKNNPAPKSYYCIDFMSIIHSDFTGASSANYHNYEIDGEIKEIDFTSIVEYDDAHKKDYYADVTGRVDPTISNEPLKNPVHIMRHILKEECGVVDFDEDEYDVAVSEYDGWWLGFSISEKINAKKLLEEISQHTFVFPRVKNNGKFGFVTLKREYEQADYENSVLIDENDIIEYNFKLTDINKLITKIDGDYAYDYASKEFTERFSKIGVSNNVLEFYGIEDSDDNKITTEWKYANDWISVRNFISRKFFNESSPHLIINIQLPLQYSELEVGSLIKFEKDKLIDGMKAYGMDYTNPIVHGGAYRYPLFIVKEIQRSLNSMTISCYHLHRITDIDISFSSEFWNEDNFPNINLEDPANELDVLEDIDVDIEDITEIDGLSFLIGADSEFSRGGKLFPSAYERHFRFVGTNNNYNLKFEHFHALMNFNLSDWNDLVPSNSVLAGNGGFDSGFDRRGGFVAIDIRMTPKNPNDNDYYILSLRNVAQTAFDVDNYFGWDVETFEIPERFLTYAQGGEHMNNDTKQGNRASTSDIRLGWVLINSNPAWEYVSCYNHGMTGISNNIDFTYNESYYGENNLIGQSKDFTYSMVLYPHFVPDETRQLPFSTFLNAQMSSNVDFINSEWNVLDVVLMINFILGADTPWIDVNSDGEVDILDVVLLVDIILRNV